MSVHDKRLMPAVRPESCDASAGSGSAREAGKPSSHNTPEPAGERRRPPSASLVGRITQDKLKNSNGSY
jgi:hypothetical protein